MYFDSLARMLNTAERPANKLREIRESRQISQAAIADMCGIGQHQVNRWENGALIPTRHVLVICQKLGVSADHLLGVKQ